MSEFLIVHQISKGDLLVNRLAEMGARNFIDSRCHADDIEDAREFIVTAHVGHDVLSWTKNNLPCVLVRVK